MKRYTLTDKQLRDMLYSAMNIDTGESMFKRADALMDTLTPEPSVDVVERVDALLRPFCHDGDRPLAVSAVQSIIEAEVERRVRKRAAAPAMPVKHDPDDWPEPGMEEKR